MFDHTPTLSAVLLDWYDRHARVLPWRRPPARRNKTTALPDSDHVWPYHVWLSEIMLQQTTVPAVVPYFLKFVERWPNVEALAAAPLDDVLQAWAGLGYYARARNLHKCAGVVARERDGRFPAQEAELRELPGVGPYTAAAIAAIAFGVAATVVDGNVERVMARLYAVETPLPAAKPELTRRAAALTPATRPGDYAQAVMDLGATVCTPRAPDCGHCPWAGRCRARATGLAEVLPARRPKPVRPVRYGDVFWVESRDPATGVRLVLIRRRPERGLLGGMIEFPTGVWHTEADGKTGSNQLNAAAFDPPIIANWHRVPGLVSHTFTHFHLELQVHCTWTGTPDPGAGIWHPALELHQLALPSVMKKVAVHAARYAAEHMFNPVCEEPMVCENSRPAR